MVAKVFKSGNSRAIRIPKGLLPEDVEYVDIEVFNDELIIRPKRIDLDTLYEMIEENKKITQDFLENREQPEVQTRELF